MWDQTCWTSQRVLINAVGKMLDDCNCHLFAAVLKSLKSLDHWSDDALRLNSKATVNDATDDHIYNVKSDLMRLIANLVYQHPNNQHMVILVLLYTIARCPCLNKS